MSATRSDLPVLVTGATGMQGNAIARALLDGGHHVRALTRDRESTKAQALASLGVEVAVGDLLNADTLIEPMRGVSAVYAITTPFGGNGAELEQQQGRELIAAAVSAAVPWFILASVGNADRGTGIPHFESKARVEQQLSATELDWTVVAPTYFYDNLRDVHAIAEGGELAIALPADTPLAQLSLADLGAVAVAVLARRDEFVGVRLDLAADTPTPAQMAAAIAAASGRPVSFSQTPRSAVAARNADVAAMYKFLAERGYSVDPEAVRARFPEVPFQSFAEWARDQFQ